MTVDARDMLNTLTVTVRLIHVREWRVRVWLGKVLLVLACRMMRCGLRFEE